MAVATDHDMNRTEFDHTHDAEYGAVNQSGTFIFLAAIVAMGVALPLAFFF